MRHKSSIRWMILSAFLVLSCSLLFMSSRAAGMEEVPGQIKIRLAVWEKMPRGQSARRFGYLYPSLTQNLREALSKDPRFALISQSEVDRVLASRGISKEKINPDRLDQLREIARQAGADFVFLSYYYEMSCHGGSMRSDNVLLLLAVDGEERESIEKSYNHELSEKEIYASDAGAIQELLRAAEPLLTKPRAHSGQIDMKPEHERTEEEPRCENQF